jgi:hybrid cluster-associated redox disulfide protein
MSQRRSKITKKMTIGEIIKKYPKSIFVFIDYGFHCIGCPAAQTETLEEAAEVHQIDLQKLLRDLIKAI